MKNFWIYASASLIKTIFWIILLVIDFTMISPKDDLAIAALGIKLFRFLSSAMAFYY